MRLTLVFHGTEYIAMLTCFAYGLRARMEKQLAAAAAALSEHPEGDAQKSWAPKAGRGQFREPVPPTLLALLWYVSFVVVHLPGGLASVPPIVPATETSMDGRL